MRLDVPPRALLLLVPVVVLVVATSLVLELVNLSPGGGPFPGFDRVLAVARVDREATLPAWLSSSLLLLSALLLLGSARAAWRERSPWRWHWALLVAAFAYLSADEGAGLHEHGTLLLDRLGVETSLTTSWLLLALPLAALFALVMVPFLRHLPRLTALRMVATGALYVGGAAGLEVVGTFAAEVGGGGDSAPYVLASHAEELVEMLAVVLFAWTVADHEHRSRALRDAADAAPRHDAGDGAGAGRTQHLGSSPSPS